MHVATQVTLSAREHLYIAALMIGEVTRREGMGQQHAQPRAAEALALVQLSDQELLSLMLKLTSGMSSIDQGLQELHASMAVRR